MIARFLLALVAVTASANAAAAADPARYMDAELLAETAAPRPGSTILVGFRFSPKPGWHGYWSNPGDSGIAPTVRWTAPDGVTFGPLLHPAPTLISADGIDSFVHEGPHVLVSRMTVPASVAKGMAIPVMAKLNWAACTATQCVPLRASFTLELVAGDGASGPNAAILRAAANKVPPPATGATVAVDRDELRLRLPQSLKLDASRTRFFPDRGGYFDSATARSSGDGGAVLIASPAKGDVPRSPSGVVSDGRRAYRVTFAAGVVSGDAKETQVAEPATAPDVAPQPDVRPAAAPSAPPRVAAAPKDEPEQPVLPWLALACLALAGGWLMLRKR